MLFDRFWGVARDIISLNNYAGIFKQKYVTKGTDNNHFYHSNDFFLRIIEILVITLCIYLAGYLNIKCFYT